MTEITGLGVFLAASVILIITPGPDTMYVIARGVGQGRKAGLLSALGICTGLLFHILAAVLGLSLLLRTSALAFSFVKYAGCVYLLYLGIMTLRDKSGTGEGLARPPAPNREIFLQGVVTNVLNPKICIFFLAFLPQFVNGNDASRSMQMFMLGAIFTVMGLCWLGGLALLSGRLGEKLRTGRGWAGKLKWISGSVMIGLGLNLAFMDRK